MEGVKLYVYVVLKHILDLGQKSPIDLYDGDRDDDHDHEDYDGSVKLEDDYERLDDDDDRAKSRRRRLRAAGKKHPKGTKISQMDLLDLDGPKLMIGAKTWLMFYQILGQLNWLDKPLYLSFLYKSIVFIIVAINMSNRFIIKMYHLNIVNENYRNPIFLFISFLAAITLTLQVLLSFRANLLDLCPFFKILSTAKLCFVKQEVQHIVGTRWLEFMLMFFVYNGVVICMLVSKDLEHFINEFRLFDFLVDLYAITVLTVSMTGMSLLDLYIRTCFGHWLLALKNHIESRFTYLHRHQRRLMKMGKHSSLAMDTNCVDALSISDTATTANATLSRPLLTFDEIQKHLNKMDDHLEATRSVQIGSLVLLSLNAFLLNGTLFLLFYHLLADQHNFYHGFLVLLLAINCIFVMFLCYSGDRWLFYALSSFTQTVEDEYFMQSDIRPLTSTNRLSWNQPPRRAEQAPPIEQLDLEWPHCQSLSSHHMLLIKKKDVLFCHEFLHQFENHLATPWSNLTVKTHLHMLRTFVTLIAAQIIFDHEH